MISKPCKIKLTFPTWESLDSETKQIITDQLKYAFVYSFRVKDTFSTGIPNTEMQIQFYTEPSDPTDYGYFLWYIPFSEDCSYHEPFTATYDESTDSYSMDVRDSKLVATNTWLCRKYLSGSGSVEPIGPIKGETKDGKDDVLIPVEPGDYSDVTPVTPDCEKICPVVIEPIIDGVVNTNENFKQALEDYSDSSYVFIGVIPLYNSPKGGDRIFDYNSINEVVAENNQIALKQTVDYYPSAGINTPDSIPSDLLDKMLVALDWCNSESDVSAIDDIYVNVKQDIPAGWTVGGGVGPSPKGDKSTDDTSGEKGISLRSSNSYYCGAVIWVKLKKDEYEIKTYNGMYYAEIFTTPLVNPYSLYRPSYYSGSSSNTINCLIGISREYIYTKYNLQELTGKLVFKGSPKMRKTADEPSYKYNCCNSIELDYDSLKLNYSYRYYGGSDGIIYNTTNYIDLFENGMETLGQKNLQDLRGINCYLDGRLVDVWAIKSFDPSKKTYISGVDSQDSATVPLNVFVNAGGDHDGGEDAVVTILGRYIDDPNYVPVDSREYIYFYTYNTTGSYLTYQGQVTSSTVMNPTYTYQLYTSQSPQNASTLYDGTNYENHKFCIMNDYYVPEQVGPLGAASNDDFRAHVEDMPDEYEFTELNQLLSDGKLWLGVGTSNETATRRTNMYVFEIVSSS